MGLGVAVLGSQRVRGITISSSRIRTFHSDPMALRFHSHNSQASRSDFLRLCLFLQAPSAFLSRCVLSVTCLSTLEQATWASIKIRSTANVFRNTLCATFRGSSQNALRKASLRRQQPGFAWSFSCRVPPCECKGETGGSPARSRSTSLLMV